MKKLFPLLIVPFLALAFNDIHSKQLLGYHHFRQAHTALTARNFAFHDANILHPTVDGVTYGKDLYLNEFPLYPWLVGLLWRAFGESLLAARLLSVLCAVLALWYYARLLEAFLDDRLVVILAVFALSLTPVVAYFARTVQRQSLFLFLLLAGIYHAARCMKKSGGRDLFFGAAGLAGALLLNPFAAYAAVPLAWLAFARERGRACLRWRLWLIAFAAAAPACAWYAYAWHTGRALPTARMMAVTDQRSFFSAAHYAMWLVPKNWERVFRAFSHFVVPPVTSLLLCLYGLRAARAPGYRFFKAWLAAVLAYFALDFYPVAVVVHHYYYINVAPLTALFFAAGAAAAGRALWSRLGGRASGAGGRVELGWASPRGRAAPAAAAFVLAMAFFALESYARARHMADDEWHAQYYRLAEPLSAAVPPGAKVTVIADSNDPLFVYIMAPRMTHRLVAYRPGVPERLLAEGDFDYLLVLAEHARFPLREVTDAIRRSGAAEEPVLPAPGAILYKKK